MSETISSMLPPDLLLLLLMLIPGAPLVSAVVTAVLGPKLLRCRSHLPCWSALAVSFICSLLVLLSLPTAADPNALDVIAPLPAVASDDSIDAAGEPTDSQETPTIAAADAHQHMTAAAASPELIVIGPTWLELGQMHVGFDLRVDSISAIMLAMVTGVSLLVALFGSGYMHGDAGYPRFFAAVSGFVFSMCMLVMANNFVLLFFFWEMVGLCSYLLIGFWFHKPSAAAASRKAFVVNRIGDFGLIMAIFLILTNFGSVSFSDVLGNPRMIADLAAANETLLPLICFCLFLGAMGKSAQFPLQVWLPDAMEGPTPVSALIHAATMVTAGIYLVARCTPLFMFAPDVQVLVSATGAITSLIAALIALTQTDLKRVLAYSTVSQLGFMFMALGCGAAGAEVTTPAVTAGMFHLFTHAYFKALLFLAAGSVMHAMGDVIDMRYFSGLRKALPITHWTFLVGAAALAGVPLLAGFWSKDEILAVLGTAASTGDYQGIFRTIQIVATVTALLTAFYTFRAYFMTFWGEERFPAEAGHHPHEATPIMAWPLRILAVCAALIGLAVGPTHLFQTYLQRTTGLTPYEAHFHLDVMAMSAVIAIAGIVLAWSFYVVSPAVPAKIARILTPFYLLSQKKFFLDEILYGIVVAPLKIFGRICVLFDRAVIDCLIDSLATVPASVSGLLKNFQGGVVTSYAGVMWFGAVAAVVVALSLF